MLRLPLALKPKLVAEQRGRTMQRIPDGDEGVLQMDSSFLSGTGRNRVTPPCPWPLPPPSRNAADAAARHTHRPGSCEPCPVVSAT